MPENLLPVIPQTITVHLGPPDSPAENVAVYFPDYVRNVASSEIYPTWPENALRANIYAIISFALNRVYTEHYRSRGYDFDITSTTAFDQAYVKDRDTFENIDYIVDDIFNDYIVKGNSIEPYFAGFCNGTTSVCPGLSQWGTTELANRGFTPIEILKYYYGDDIRIVENAPFMTVGESYPGVILKLGDFGNNIKILQTELNRISRNFPAIPKISEENGIYGPDTENAVSEFQRIFSLPVTGRVDKATWYKIKQYYVGVKMLSDLVSEGVSLSEVQVPFKENLKLGDSGIEVRVIQYYLNIISYFNSTFQRLNFDGIFDSATENDVKKFQEYYGLPVTGVVDIKTWYLMTDVYSASVATLPPDYSGGYSKFYPGYFLSEGMSGQDVTDLQTYLSLIGRYYAAVPEIPVTGYFGPQTANAVREFQRLFGLLETGSVGPVTWATIAEQYDFLLSEI